MIDISVTDACKACSSYYLACKNNRIPVIHRMCVCVCVCVCGKHFVLLDYEIHKMYILWTVLQMNFYHYCDKISMAELCIEIFIREA